MSLAKVQISTGGADRVGDTEAADTMLQSDDVIWDIINNQFCSFKASVARERTFCQNPYNVSGLCLKSACPLANSRYATIREEEGLCYLYMKTAERAHSPRNLWEKIRLPKNYAKALEIVDQQLEFFPKYLVHRNKQRLTKIHQMIIRMRKIKLKGDAPKLVTTNTKVDRREKGRERKALQAAQLEKAIESELLERLKQVSESEIYNINEKVYSKVLEDNADSEEEEEEEDDLEYNIEYVEDVDESDEEEMEDIEQSADQLAALYSSLTNKRKAKADAGKGGKRQNVEIEYEDEEEEPARAMNSRSKR